ncbi:7756_t:CDS:2 [Funneliformis geosporum]|uniref:5119_t:CDS:1 n=1 Tax=Funneliformis geosporum TaxID=1117311 RepID=A0A9W4X3D4_9GLOM|nr:7756_t:CDS:2 [Funneliformis geosporum]CAI2192167.1 5119_t:CDS:2 [Funneliformis geosporum]
MEPNKLNVPSLTIMAFHVLLHVTILEACHVWTKQGLIDAFCKNNKSGSRRRKVQGLIVRLVQKGIINSLTTRTDNGNQEIIIYWIGPKLNDRGSSIKESRQDSIELTPKSEPSAKRLSIGNKSSRRSMTSIISKAQSKLNSSSPLSPNSPSARSYKTPLNRKSTKFKSPFKSPLFRELHDPETKDITNQERELKKEIANVEENIRKAKLVLKYQETNEGSVNELLIMKWRRASQEAAEYLFSKIPKEKSFLEEAGYSNAWGNWGWDEEGSKKQRSSYSDDEEDYKELHEKNNELKQNTMKSMLLRMGIDLELIRWNEDDECFEQ